MDNKTLLRFVKLARTFTFTEEEVVEDFKHQTCFLNDLVEPFGEEEPESKRDDYRMHDENCTKRKGYYIRKKAHEQAQVVEMFGEFQALMRGLFEKLEAERKLEEVING